MRCCNAIGSVPENTSTEHFTELIICRPPVVKDPSQPATRCIQSVSGQERFSFIRKENKIRRGQRRSLPDLKLRAGSCSGGPRLNGPPRDARGAATTGNPTRFFFVCVACVCRVCGERKAAKKGYVEKQARNGGLKKQKS